MSFCASAVVFLCCPSVQGSGQTLPTLFSLLFMVLLPPVRIWRGQEKGPFMAAGAFISELSCLYCKVCVLCVYTVTDEWLLLNCFCCFHATVTSPLQPSLTEA